MQPSLLLHGKRPSKRHSRAVVRPRTSHVVWKTTTRSALMEHLGTRQEGHQHWPSW